MRIVIELKNRYKCSCGECGEHLEGRLARRGHKQLLHELKDISLTIEQNRNMIRSIRMEKSISEIIDQIEGLGK